MKCNLNSQKASRPSFLSPSERQEYDRILALYHEKQPARTIQRNVARTMMRLGVTMKSDGIGWRIVY